MKKKNKSLSERNLNIWNRYDFAMCGIGEKNKLTGYIKHIKKCLKWSKQRIVRGYADRDVWEMYSYLQKMMPAMLQFLKDNRMGSPGYLGENHYDDKGVLVNETCHEEWDKILTRMIHYWRESDESTCTKKNRFEEAYNKASDEFRKKYGFLGQKLQTKEELEENRKRGGGCTVHTMAEIPEYADIWNKYIEEEHRLESYRDRCKNRALDLMKRHFFSLWD